MLSRRFLAGIAPGTLIFFLTQGIELIHTGRFPYTWKYGIAHAVAILALFALAKARVPVLVQPTVLAVLGLASLGLNFRSHALVCLLASATLFAHRLLGSRIRRGWQFAGVIVFGLVFAYAMPIAARAGLFGLTLQRKTIQLDATHLPMLLTVRTGPPMTITAIMESPLLGWGEERHEADAGVVRPGRASRGPDGARPDVPVRAVLAIAAQRLFRDALDPVGFLGRGRRAGRASARVAAGRLHRHRVE